MTIQERRDKYCSALRSVIGWSYQWGGESDRTGFDCSGLVLWGLRQTGLKIGDMNAQRLYDYFHPYKILPSAAPAGCLFFYWDEKRNIISHVMSVLQIWPNGTRVLCGARGGSSRTISLDASARDNALVDVVIADHYWQGNFAMCVDPFMYESDWE